MLDGLGIKGEVRWWLYDRNGAVLRSGFTRNIVTAVGDQLYASRGAGLSSSAAPTGMKLGTHNTNVAASKTGAGAALVTYLTNSHQAFDAGYPAATGGVATYQATWAAGKATTASAITEVVIVNNTLADATTAAANTISRALVTGVPSKSASEILQVVWTHTLAGT